MPSEPTATFMTNFERTEFGDSVYSAIGRALAFATRFELGVKALSQMLDLKAEPTLLSSPDEFRNWLKSVEKSTLFRNINKLGVTDQEIRCRLHAAREARNEIAHDISRGLDGCLDLLPKEHLEVTMSELSKLAVDLAEGDVIVEVLICAATNEPLPTAEFINGYPEKVKTWIINA